MKNGTFVPATQCKSHPNVKSDWKARFDAGIIKADINKPSNQQGA